MELWLEDIAKEFWRNAGLSDRFPRDMERAITNALPAAVVYLPRLWTSTIDEWLADRQLAVRIAAHRRRLRGCMLAYRGRGIIFIDGTDPESEQRFSLAHETAHLLVDYFRPRHQIVTKLGESSVEVLDGLRPPLLAERVDACLAELELKVHTHLMPRVSNGTPASSVVMSEDRADLLALELLAPSAEVRKRMPRSFSHRSYQLRQRSLARLLTSHFGLPKDAGDQYGSFLCREWFGGPSVREWLGIG